VSWGLKDILLFVGGLRSCLPNVVDAVEEDEFEAEELFVVMDFPFLLLHEESWELELDEVDPLLFGIIMLMLSTSCVEYGFNVICGREFFPAAMADIV